MVQIISISEARNTLPSLIKQIVKTNKPVIIVRGSKPSAILTAYANEPKSKNDHLQALLSVTGSWFSQEDHQAIRKETEDKLNAMK